MYGLAAAVGKIGAFVGTYVFPIIIDSFPAGPAQAAGPFYVGSGLAVFSAIIVYFLIPEIPVDHVSYLTLSSPHFQPVLSLFDSLLDLSLLRLGQLWNRTDRIA